MRLLLHLLLPCLFLVAIAAAVSAQTAGPPPLEPASPAPGRPAASGEPSPHAPAVVELQSLLAFVQRSPLPETGVLDDATRGALMKFQVSVGLEPGTTVDERSLERLRAEAKKAFDLLGFRHDGFAEALQAFQKGHRLRRDATFGPATREALEAALRVRELQQALANEGFYRGALDGDAGASGFKQALMDYQQARGLPVTAQLDDATMASLKAVAPTGTPAPVASPSPLLRSSSVLPAGDLGRGILIGLLAGIPLGAIGMLIVARRRRRRRG